MHLLNRDFIKSLKHKKINLYSESKKIKINRNIMGGAYIRAGEFGIIYTVFIQFQ